MLLKQEQWQRKVLVYGRVTLSRWRDTRAPDIRDFLTPVHFEALDFMPKKIFDRSKCKGNLIARYVHSFGFLVKIKTQELNNLTCPSYSDGYAQL